MSDVQGLVYLKTGTFSGVAAVLARHGDILSLTTDEGERFRVPESNAVVKFPRRYFGGAMTVRVGTTTYVLSFIRPGNLDTGVAEGLAARRSSKEWKAAFGR